METYFDLNGVKILNLFFVVVEKLRYKIFLTVDVRLDRTYYAQEHMIILSTFANSTS